MHVAFIHPDLGLGGAERLVVDTARCLQAAGHRVTIFTAAHDRRRSFEETPDEALDVRVRGQRLPAQVAGHLRAPCAITRMAYLGAASALRRADVIVCDLVAHALPLVRWRTHAPLVFYCHFPDRLLSPLRHSAAYRAYRRPIDWLEGWGMRSADCILVNSQFTAEQLHAAFPSRQFAAQVLHPGIDAARYAGTGVDAESSSVTLLSIARFTGAKNLGLAIEAFAAVRRRVPAAAFAEWRLVMAGGYDDGVAECRDTLRRLQSQAQQLGLADRVDFRLSISEAERLRLLAQCRCVVYTPVREHFGFVPLEAMASGRPVIAVDSGGVRETVRHGETGFLCAPSADAFADALIPLLNDPAAARHIGQAGRRHVAQRFSLHAFGVQWNAVLEDVVGRQRRNPAIC